MKKTLQQFGSGVFVGIAVTLASLSLVGWTSPDGLPPVFGDNTRTNTMTWDAANNLKAKLVVLGTSYTGVTTNYLLGGTNWNFVNGLLVQ